MIVRLLLTIAIIFLTFSIPFWVDGRGPDNVPKNLSDYISKTVIVTWILSMSLMIVALSILWS